MVATALAKFDGTVFTEETFRLANGHMSKSAADVSAFDNSLRSVFTFSFWGIEGRHRDLTPFND